MGSADGVARPRLYLIDGSGYVYRAFHALPGLGTTRGLPTNAVYGFTTMLAKLLREESPQHVVVVFDAPGETFRDGLFASYKANRAPMPDELRPQLGYIRKVVEALRLPTLEVPGVEADDVIGTLARQAGRAAIETVLVTGDRTTLEGAGHHPLRRADLPRPRGAALPRPGPRQAPPALRRARVLLPAPRARSRGSGGRRRVDGGRYAGGDHGRAPRAPRSR